METVIHVLENCTAYIMEVLKNLLGNNTKINAKEIATIFEGSPETIDVILTSLKAERGSNANGEYFKFPNGLLVCLQRRSRSSVVTTPWGVLYREDQSTRWVFPLEATGIFYVDVRPLGGYAGGGYVSHVSDGTYMDSRLYHTFANTEPNAKEALLMVGSWKK